MTSTREIFHFSENFDIKVVKVRVSDGHNITYGQTVIHFERLQPEDAESQRTRNECNAVSSNAKHLNIVKSTVAGLVEKMLVREGDILRKGAPILEYSVCTHPTVMKDMCAECGADLREIQTRIQTAAVAMVHCIPELMVSMKEAQSLGKADEERLLRDRKLVLLVDLDQTLIHTTNDDIPPNIEDVFHFQLQGTHSPWYHTRLRPFTRKFLDNIHSMYELHICTFGSRTYAHTIARLLDGEGRYFSHRILSRDECFSAHSKTANLKALFPCGDHMVVIIDDREDVWNFAPNLIHVRPYHFFQHTGDINAPPGLTKKEKDEKEGFDFTSMQATTKSNSELSNVNELSLTNNITRSLVEETKTVLDEKPSSDQSTDSLVNEPTLPAIPETKDHKSDGSSSVESMTTDCLDQSQDSELPTKLVTHIHHQTHIPLNPESSINEDQSESPTKLAASTTVSLGTDDPDKGHIHVNDTDDYLLYLQEILRTIHHAYYEMYDNCIKGEESNPIPDMKIVLPYVRRKVLENVRVVFSGLIPTNAQLKKSRPYLVARSLGAIVDENVTKDTTHVVAVRLGTSKLIEAKTFKHIHVVTPDWLWTCAERWERVDERLYPLSSDATPIRRKPPAHCTSPDVSLQLAIRGSAVDKGLDSLPVYDRATGKRIFRDVLKTGKSPDSDGNANPTVPDDNFIETVNPLLAFSSEDIADMDREVEDILDDNDTDGLSTDEEEKKFNEELVQDGKDPPSRKRKREDVDRNLFIGHTSDPDSPTNETLNARFRRGEAIPILDSDESDDDGNEDEVEDLEVDEEPEDSELCLAGQALEREFLSEED